MICIKTRLPLPDPIRTLMVSTLFILIIVLFKSICHYFNVLSVFCLTDFPIVNKIRCPFLFFYLSTKCNTSISVSRTRICDRFCCCHSSFFIFNFRCFKITRSLAITINSVSLSMKLTIKFDSILRLFVPFFFFFHFFCFYYLLILL